MRARWLLALLLGACSADAGSDVDDEDWLDGKGDGASAVDVAATHLDIDVTARTAVATIELEKNGNVELEIGDLVIEGIVDDRGNRKFKIAGGKLRVSQVRGAMTITYSFLQHDMANGLLPGGSTVIWPYFCGNLFPCHSKPADGTTFTLALTGVPRGKTAIFPESISADAPPYQLAWAVGSYKRIDLGTTGAGTKVFTSYLPNGESPARRGTAHLVKVFDWYEKTLGPYTCGNEVGSVSVIWGEGFFGGMEHHPYWHVARDAMGDGGIIVIAGRNAAADQSLRRRGGRASPHRRRAPGHATPCAARRRARCATGRRALTSARRSAAPAPPPAAADRAA